jgi:hypothetical protein
MTQVSGGILKEKKCSVYFLAFKFIHGRAQMMTLWDLPSPRIFVTDNEDCTYPTHICIPQQDGPNVPIETHDVTTASKMLGITSLLLATPLLTWNIWSRRA